MVFFVLLDYNFEAKGNVIICRQCNYNCKTDTLTPPPPIDSIAQEIIRNKRKRFYQIRKTEFENLLTQARDACPDIPNSDTKYIFAVKVYKDGKVELPEHFLRVPGGGNGLSEAIENRKKCIESFFKISRIKFCEVDKELTIGARGFSVAFFYNGIL